MPLTTNNSFQIKQVVLRDLYDFLKELQEREDDDVFPTLADFVKSVKGGNMTVALKDDCFDVTRQVYINPQRVGVFQVSPSQVSDAKILIRITLLDGLSKHLKEEDFPRGQLSDPHHQALESFILDAFKQLKQEADQLNVIISKDWAQNFPKGRRVMNATHITFDVAACSVIIFFMTKLWLENKEPTSSKEAFDKITAWITPQRIQTGILCMLAVHVCGFILSLFQEAARADRQPPVSPDEINRARANSNDHVGTPQFSSHLGR